MTVIYIDILLALNLFIDYLLLAATARVLQLPAGRYRLILGAVVGALCSLIILAPPLPSWATLLFQCGSAAVMTAAAFRFGGVVRYIKTVAVFFVISAVFAGVCTLVWHVFAPRGIVVQNGTLYYDVPPLLLVTLTVAAYGVLCVYDRLTRKRAALGRSYHVRICEGERELTLRALLDTGHSLVDSFSGAPVIIADRSSVMMLRDCFDMVSVSGRVRYIPYSSLGGSGVLPSFRPSSAWLLADGREADISGVWIAVTPTLGRGEYDALISPAVADMI